MVTSAGLRHIEGGGVAVPFGDSAADEPTSQFLYIRSGSVQDKKETSPSQGVAGPRDRLARGPFVYLIKTRWIDGTES
jgi:hypothetical protein